MCLRIYRIIPYRKGHTDEYKLQQSPTSQCFVFGHNNQTLLSCTLFLPQIRDLRFGSAIQDYRQYKTTLSIHCI